MLNLLRKIVKPKVRKVKGDDEITREVKVSKTVIKAAQLNLLRNDEKALVEGWIPGINYSSEEFKKYKKEVFKDFDHHKCPCCFLNKLQQLFYKREKTIFYCHNCNKKLFLYTFYFEPPVPGWSMDMNYEVYFFFKEQ